MQPKPIPALQMIYGMVIVPAPIVAAMRFKTDELTEPAARKPPDFDTTGSSM